MRAPVVIAAASLFAAVDATAQMPPATGHSVAAEASQRATETAEEDRWSFSGSISTYVVPDDHDYVQPTITADRGWLHLEGRYNYEALETGSAWLGYNFSGGEALVWELTPMIGGIVGNTWGFAPGFKGAIGWWKLELYSEGEYVFDTTNSSESFFYSWSELGLAPVDWCRLGFAGQRTRTYESDREIQRGVFGGISYKALELTTYVFDPDTSEPTVVVAVGATF